MGSTVKPNGKIVSFLGSESGVGTSTLATLLGRFLAKAKKGNFALVDAKPFDISPIPNLLSISSSIRTLDQLFPYENQLDKKTIENFFSISPEGFKYIPLCRSKEPNLDHTNSLTFIKKLTSFFDFIFLDLSSFQIESHINLIENSHKLIVLSTFEASSVIALKKLEKFSISKNFPMHTFGIVFNQNNPSQILNNEVSQWIRSFKHLGNLCFIEENFSQKMKDNHWAETVGLKIETAFFENTITYITSYHITEAVNFNNHSADNGSTSALLYVQQLHQKLLARLRSSGLVDNKINNTEAQRQSLEPKALDILNELIQDFKIEDRGLNQKLIAETLDLCFGLGPLEPLLKDESVSEIMVNGPNQVYIEKKGLLEKANIIFYDDQQLKTVIERILAPIGRRIDESQPYVDGRLLDGSRINAIIPPLSLCGPILTIRKFSKKKLTVQDLIKFGSITQEAADFLGACVQAKKNIIVSGGTGSGKTTLLNILSGYIPGNERIVTIEDSAELQLSQDHVVRLEARPANLEGKGLVNIRDLVINSLRMRPDRIVVGEVRSGEALDMLQAMNTGHDGSLTTAHANTPRDVLARLETMCLFTGLPLPVRAIREQIARAIHLVVQQNRLSNGKRSITKISEIQGMEGEVVLLQDLFVYDDEKGLIRNPFPPKFMPDLESIGYRWPKQG